MFTKKNKYLKRHQIHNNKNIRAFVESVPFQLIVSKEKYKNEKNSVQSNDSFQ